MDHATYGVRWDVTDSQAAVMYLRNFKLSRRRVATEREYGERGTADVSGDGGFEELQSHGIEVSPTGLASHRRRTGDLPDMRTNSPSTPYQAARRGGAAHVLQNRRGAFGASPVPGYKMIS
jgi:hypothetical protein